jgi:hypothetical protein
MQLATAALFLAVNSIRRYRAPEGSCLAIPEPPNYAIERSTRGVYQVRKRYK